MIFDGVVEFVAVADGCSFTVAARKLRTSVAHVSRSVGALENRLGVKLLHRTTRKVSLSEVGHLYYQHCRPLVEGLIEAERAVTEISDKPVGTLRFTAPVAYGEKILAPLLSEFMRKYSALQIDLELTNRKLDLIEGGFDLAIRLGKLEDSSLTAKKLAQRTLHVCAAPQYIERFGEPHTLSELDHHNCLLGTLDYWRLKEGGKTRNIRVSGNMRCNNGPTLLNAALDGHGVVQLPDYYVHGAFETGKLIALLKKHQPDTEGIWALYPPSRHMSPKVRLFIDYLQAELPKFSGRQMSG